MEIFQILTTTPGRIGAVQRIADHSVRVTISSNELPTKVHDVVATYATDEISQLMTHPEIIAAWRQADTNSITLTSQ